MPLRFLDLSLVDSHLNFVHISIFIESKNFILGTNIQQDKVHLFVKVQVTLTDAEGHR